MIRNQFGRRNLTPYTRGVLALAMEGIFKAKAKANKVVAGALYGEKHAKEEVLATLPKPLEKVDTRKEVADIAKIGERTLDKVKTIEAKATPEVKAMLASGDSGVSINKVYQDIRKAEKKEVRKADIQKQVEEIEAGALPQLTGKFHVLSVDPPWPYGREYDPEGSRVANPYPEMSIEQIKAIDLPATDDSVLFLWTTHAFLPSAFEIAKHWGYTYKANMVWDKESIGMGAWLRMQCEFCLVCIKGAPFWDNTKHRDIIRAKRREHSRKPDEFFDIVSDMCQGRKLEHFSREAREGWEIFGNDINKF